LQGGVGGIPLKGGKSNFKTGCKKGVRAGGMGHKPDPIIP